ncbi:hypothetical protein ABH944_001001 [Caballeronia udeis]|uniref:Lipoprotein n=1 Tax=Caballeronia udeis TaxID=1232866 RepID=A0ABW8MCW6_9BURK
MKNVFAIFVLLIPIVADAQAMYGGAMPKNGIAGSGASFSGDPSVGGYMPGSGTYAAPNHGAQPDADAYYDSDPNNNNSTQGNRAASTAQPGTRKSSY